MLSVLMTVYEKENAAFFRESLQSICAQTLPVNELVLVKDGELNDALDEVISEFTRMLPLEIISRPKEGRCLALQSGVAACRSELIAIMDSDDICLSHRLELQAEVMKHYSEVDVVGGAVAEFMFDHRQPRLVRRLPQDHEQIVVYAKRRNPINQTSVMFRRDAVLRAGNYQHSPGFEDWCLWNRMIQTGSRFMNLDEVLVLVRVGNGMLTRRSGLEYVKQEIAFHRKMYSSHFLSAGEAFRNLAVRIPVRLAPESVIRTVYTKALRSPA